MLQLPHTLPIWHGLIVIPACPHAFSSSHTTLPARYSPRSVALDEAAAARQLGADFESGVVTCEAPLGSVLLFNNLTVHRCTGVQEGRGQSPSWRGGRGGGLFGRRCLGARRVRKHRRSGGMHAARQAGQPLSSLDHAHTLHRAHLTMRHLAPPPSLQGHWTTRAARCAGRLICGGSGQGSLMEGAPSHQSLWCKAAPAWTLTGETGEDAGSPGSGVAQLRIGALEARRGRA